jgi:hypothetical protein
VTFEDDKKSKVLGTDIIKVNDRLTLNNVALVDRLRYNLLSLSQLCDADLSVHCCKRCMRRFIGCATKSMEEGRCMTCVKI